MAMLTVAPDPIRSYAYHPVGGLEVSHGEGVYLYDVDGRDYLDAASATFNLSLGYRHPVVLAAVAEQLDQLVHATSSFTNGPVAGLTRRLGELSPANLRRVHLKSSGGSTANEGAIKIAQTSTGAEEVVTLFRSHIGQTLTTLRLSGNAFRSAPFPGGGVPSLKVPDPYCHRCFYGQEPTTCGLLCVERIHDFLDHASGGRVAAVIVEPISGNGGNIVAPPGYLAALRRLCDERGIVLVFDEVQTGIGRTGRLFASDHFGVSPHVMTLAKGLGGSGFPIAAILAEDHLDGLGPDDHSFTNGANVLSAAAANATLDVVTAPGFLEQVRAVGAHLHAGLSALAAEFAFVGDVRGVGLMLGFETVGPGNVVDPDRARRVAAAALDEGLILRTSMYGRGNVVKVRPPLICTTADADELLARLGRSLAVVR